MRALPLLLAVLLLGTIVPNPLQAATIFNEYVEDFSTTQYKSPANTAFWDTVNGELGLHPFQISVAGSYDTPGTAAALAIDGGIAVVADGATGIVVLDISDPAIPGLLGSLDTPVSAQGVDLQGSLAFIADMATGLLIIDISDPTAPTQIGNYNSAGTSMDVAVAGDHAFLADDFGGVTVVDVTDPSNPVLASSYDTPGRARTLQISGNHLYVADRSDGLIVLDVTDPTAPLLAGNLDTPGDNWGVAVDGNVAYLGDASAGVQVVDVSDPTTPTLITNFNPGGSWRRLNVDGDYLFGAAYGSMFIVDVSNPAAPILIEEIVTPGIASDVAVGGEHAYIADGAVGGMQVLDVADGVPQIFSIGSSWTLDQSGMAISGNYLYAGDAGNPLSAADMVTSKALEHHLRAVDISDPSNPTIVGSLALPAPIRAVAVEGDVALVAADARGLFAVDISDPTTLATLDWVVLPGEVIGVTAAGNHAYAILSSGGLRVVRIQDPSFLTPVGFLSPGGILTGGVCVEGNTLFMTAESDLVSVDVTDPAHPVLLDVLPTGGTTSDVAVAGGYAYVSQGDGLGVIDVRDPLNMIPVGDHAVTASNGGVALSGNRCVMASVGQTTVFDVSDPLTPRIVASYHHGGQELALAGDNLFVSASTEGLQILHMYDRDFNQVDVFGRSTLIGGGYQNIVQVRLTASQFGNNSWWVRSGLLDEFVVPDGTWQVLQNPGPGFSWTSAHYLYQVGVNPRCVSLDLAWLYEGGLIESIEDVGNDQGRQVRVSWDRSGHDYVGSASPILEYAIYRKVDPDLASVESSSGKEDRMDPELASLPDGQWDFVATVPADAEDSYSMVVPTLGDSTIADGDYFSTFLVRARTSTPGLVYDSPPDSGYSVDNLAPNVPTGFVVASMPATGNQLDWLANVDEDFRYYRVYRSTVPGFEPEPSNLVHSTTGESWHDPVEQPWLYLYKITATDFSGIESEAAEPEKVTSSGGTPAIRSYALHQNHPNPFNPTTLIRYEVPVGGGEVLIRIYDVSGRRLRTLVSEHRDEGVYTARWNGLDDAGRTVASGVYYLELRAADTRLKRKMSLVR